MISRSKLLERQRSFNNSIDNEAQLSTSATCKIDNSYSNSLIIQIAVDVFYLLGGFLAFFGILLNILCVLVVTRSKVYKKECYGLYLKLICITDIFKLLAEYQVRILIMVVHSFLVDKSNTSRNKVVNNNSSISKEIYTEIVKNQSLVLKSPESEFLKFIHCNLRLAFIMITENLSYMYCIMLAADRCCRMWNNEWARKKITLTFTKRLTLAVSIGVLLYCHPHFYPVNQCSYIHYARGFLTNQAYSDCDVLSNVHKYLSFEFYWLRVESIVNSIVLPIVLTLINILLSIAIKLASGRHTRENETTSKSVARLSITKNKQNEKKLVRKRSIASASKEASFVVLGDTCLFLIVITPVNAFTYFFKQYDERTRNLKTAFQLIGLTFSLINHSFNGLVYIICSRTFRDEMCKTIRAIIPIGRAPHRSLHRQTNSKFKRSLRTLDVVTVDVDAAQQQESTHKTLINSQNRSRMNSIPNGKINKGDTNTYKKNKSRYIPVLQKDQS
jgi:hypothetical protein